MQNALDLISDSCFACIISMCFLDAVASLKTMLDIDSFINVFKISRLKSIREYYSVLQSVTEYNRVLESVTECYRV